MGVCGKEQAGRKSFSYGKRGYPTWEEQMGVSSSCGGVHDVPAEEGAPVEAWL